MLTTFNTGTNILDYTLINSPSCSAIAVKSSFCSDFKPGHKKLYIPDSYFVVTGLFRACQGLLPRPSPSHLVCSRSSLHHTAYSGEDILTGAYKSHAKAQHVLCFLQIDRSIIERGHIWYDMNIKNISEGKQHSWLSSDLCWDVSNLQRDALFRRVKGFSESFIDVRIFLFYFCCSFIKSSVKMSTLPFKIMFILSMPHELFPPPYS